MRRNHVSANMEPKHLTSAHVVMRKAVQRRSAARRQAAALQAVHDRSACQLDAAQRAQQAAAALQRGVTVSRQIATLQAQGLLSAAAAMQVRSSILTCHMDLCGESCGRT